MSLLTDYEQRTMWKYEPVCGAFHTPDSLKNKVSDEGEYRPFAGTTVVFRMDGMGTKIIEMMQKVLNYWLEDTQMLASLLPSDSIHMTLHDLVCPENCKSNEEKTYRDELKKSQERAVAITEKIRKEYKGRKITMVADRIVNMVSKSIVLLLKPSTEQDYELLQTLYSHYDEIASFPHPYTPHITLAYFRPGMLDGDKLWNAIEHAQICPETAPVFEFDVEAITVQAFDDMTHYQDIPRRICFCCDGGMNRSVMAANIMNDLAKEQGIPLVCEARAAFPDAQGKEIPQLVWYTLKSNGFKPDQTDTITRYLEKNEGTHFTQFAGITSGAYQNFLLTGIPEERFSVISEYFMGIPDPQYGEVTVEEAFQEVLKRVKWFLSDLK